MIQTVDLPQYGSSTGYVRETLEACRDQYILLNISGREVTITDEAAQRMKECAQSSGAGMVYSDYIKTMGADATVPAPLIDIQSGSLRDDFDFGALVLLTPQELTHIWHSKAMSSRPPVSTRCVWPFSAACP